MIGRDVPVPQAVVAAGDRELEALLADLERTLEALAVAEHALRKIDPDRDEHARAAVRITSSSTLGQPGGVTELARETVLQRREQSVDLEDAVCDRPQLASGAFARHRGVQLLGGLPASGR